MGTWAHGHMRIWAHAHMRIWAHGHMGTWAHGHMGIWAYGACGAYGHMGTWAYEAYVHMVMLVELSGDTGADVAYVVVPGAAHYCVGEGHSGD